MKIKKNIALSDSGFVFNPGTGESFSVNPVGAEILQMIKEKKDKDQIKTLLLKKYNVDESVFERDLDDFINMMKHHHLLENGD